MGENQRLTSIGRYDEFHDRIARTHRQTRLVREGNFTYVNFFRFILPAIAERRRGRILDIGSGAGTLSLFLAHLGHTVVGIDVSSLAVEASSRSSRDMALEDRASFFRADFMEYSPEEGFDIILCLEVLEHCEDDVGLLAKAYDLVNPGGLFVLSSPLATAPLARMGAAARFDAAAGHLRRYESEQLVSKVRQAGFAVDRVVETEGIVRNSLFVFPRLSFLPRMIRGRILSRIVTVLDDISGALLGFSDVIVLAGKKEQAHSHPPRGEG